MSKWISLEEKLPEKGECVDIWIDFCGDSGRICNCFYDFENCLFWHWNYSLDKKVLLNQIEVTHWMHIPTEPQSNGKALTEFNTEYEG